MNDLLNMEFINSLPQPLFVRSGSWWPVHDIDVETGLFRIDVCGLLDVMHIGSVLTFRDADGNEHGSDTFYLESDDSTPTAPSQA